MSNQTDPEEYTGVNAGVKADPAHGASTVSKKPGSHAKIAIQRPKREYAAAQDALAEARVELIAATSAALAATRAEGEAMATWVKLNPPPSYAEINGERLAKAHAERTERAAVGQPLEPAKVYQGNSSPLDIAAAARGRRPSTPLRSTVVRR
jgi:hypothetical protein